MIHLSVYIVHEIYNFGQKVKMRNVVDNGIWLEVALQALIV